MIVYFVYFCFLCNQLFFLLDNETMSLNFFALLVCLTQYEDIKCSLNNYDQAFKRVSLDYRKPLQRRVNMTDLQLLSLQRLTYEVDP